MRYKKFLIRNYKGIRQLSFDLQSDPTGPVYTLVGLNESGKTTILEALSMLYENVGTDKEITLPTDQQLDDYHELIPRSSQANFSDSIVVQASLELEESDKRAIEELLQEKRIFLDKIEPEVTIKHSYYYHTSRYVPNKSAMKINTDILLRPRGNRKSITLEQADDSVRKEIEKLIVKRLPPIIYYPNFLFDFPDRIYLESVDGETKEQPFYRRFLQDVLDSLPGDLSLETHVLNRAKSSLAADKSSLESTLNQMAAQMNKTVFSQSSGLRLFKIKNRQFVVRTDLDSNGPYLEIS